MTIYSVLTIDNKRNLLDFAISVAVLQRDSANRSVDTLARGIIVGHDIATKAAFEAVLHLRRNLKTKIAVEAGSAYSILSTKDVLAICKHAMSILQSALTPYSERFSEMNLIQLAEFGHRLAGFFHRDPVVNIITGNGIHFTGLSQLYYSKTRISTVDAVKAVCGYGKYQEKNMFYLQAFPTIEQINRVIHNIVGIN